MKETLDCLHIEMTKDSLVCTAQQWCQDWVSSPWWRTVLRCWQ